MKHHYNTLIISRSTLDGRTQKTDVTQELIGRTVYIEYASSGWRGYWMGAKDNYDGAVFQVSEHSVFDPNQPCRINVIDYGGGWACL